VSSQIDVEDEARGNRKAGLSFQEIIANICGFFSFLSGSKLMSRDLHCVRPYYNVQIRLVVLDC
jgi:hypothetical protein